MINNPLSISVIGIAHSPLKQKFGLPRQPNLVPIPAVIELLPPFNVADSVSGLASFSHIWLLWQFHMNQTAPFKPLIRPPRLGGNKKMGVFASRSMFRPNHIGMSVVQLDTVDIDNGQVRLYVQGADMVDGTPILDIKPYIAYSDAITDAKSGFAKTAPMPKQVLWLEQAELAFSHVQEKSGVSISSQTDTALQTDTKDIITQLIAYDPRPAYHEHQSKKANQSSQKTRKHYKMQYQHMDVVFYADVLQTGLEVMVIADVIKIK